MLSGGGPNLIASPSPNAAGQNVSMSLLHLGLQMGGGGGNNGGNGGTGSGNGNSSSSSSGHITEQAAISEIEKSLRQYETGGNYSGSPPAYPMHSVVAPNKCLPPNRGAGMGNGPIYSNNGMTVGLNNNNATANNNNSNMQGFPMPPSYPQRPPVGVQQQRYQNMQRERLLQEQQKQQLVVPAGATNAGLNPGIGDIGSLINNTVAPNVSLQRNNSVGAVGVGRQAQQQLSPGFNANAFQQMSPGQTNRAGAPFSPVQMAKAQQQQQQQQGPPPNYQQFPNNSAEIQPMSPQMMSPEMMSLLNMNKVANPPNNNNSGVLAGQQLSPRQAPFTSPQSASQWTAQQQAQLSLQQQQNPMLNAQLTVSDGRVENLIIQ